MDRTDEALYESFVKQNDEEAMRHLFDRYRDPLTYYINGIVHNPDDAEEIMMDCFAVLIAQTTRFAGRRGSSFKTWLFAIATRKANLFFRQNHRAGDFSGSEEILSDERFIPENRLLNNEKNLALYRALNKLSPDQKTALYLRYFEDMGPEEIGRVMRKSRNQVYKLLENGMRRLRELLDQTDTEGMALWDM
ncbi:MAG: sigma-70 family RNA polymerase sigma factor [Lachnospiraceae bacterium]|nr:sigma-70 family RNA polymerase sigma factor [Lachnospiraceae bacterium]